MPTILDMCGVPIHERVQGQSLVPLVRGETDRVRDWAVSSHTMIQDDQCRSPATLYTSEWIYVNGGDEGPHKLYARQTDPDERNDLAESDPDALAEMHQRYLDMLRSIDCPDALVAGRQSPDRRPGAETVMPKFI